MQIIFATIHEQTLPLPNYCGKYQDGTFKSIFSAIMLKNDGTSV
jgi:hypothetical protein